MKQILSYFLLLSCILFTNQVMGQTLESRLNQTAPNCETIASNSQDLLPKFKIYQQDSILAILDIWEASCGYTEVIQRVKILLDLQSLSFDATDHKIYLEQHVDTYKRRWRTYENVNQHDIYEYNKVNFCYVHLQEGFDQWTAAIATQLMAEQNPESEAYLICLLLSNQFEKFEDALKSRTFRKGFMATTICKNRYNYIRAGIGYIISIGARQGIGKMNDYHGISPQIELGGALWLNYLHRIEIKGSFTRLLNRNELQFNIESIDTLSTKYNAVTIGFNFYRSKEIKQNTFLEINAGINAGILTTDFKKEKQTEDDKYHGVTTLDLEIGIGMNRRTYFNRHFGFHFELHYAPYNLDKILRTDIGGFYMNTNLVYMF